MFSQKHLVGLDDLEDFLDPQWFYEMATYKSATDCRTTAWEEASSFAQCVQTNL